MRFAHLSTTPLTIFCAAKPQESSAREGEDAENQIYSEN
jgi:hypothetical protein